VEKGGGILSSDFTTLLRAKSKRATAIAQQLKANPRYSKQILTSNRVEWCGALDEAKRLGGIRATQ
jgi:hypothetical protein